MSEGGVPDIGQRLNVPSGTGFGDVLGAIEASVSGAVGAPARLVALRSDGGIAVSGAVQLTLAEWWSRGDVQELVWDVRIASNGSTAQSAAGGPGAAIGVVRTQVVLAAPGHIAVTPDRMPDELDGRLVPGMAHEAAYTVTDDLTTDHVDGVPPVLATPNMLELMERVSQDLLLPYLAKGHTTVGARLDVAHLGPAFLGEQFVVRSVLVGVARRRLTFAVSALIDDRLLGEGRHEAHIVAYGRLAARTGRRA